MSLNYPLMLQYVSLAAPYTALGALALVLIALAYAFILHRRLSRMTLRRGDTIEDTINDLSRRTKELQLFREELEGYLKSAEMRLKRSMRGFGVVRFNPFHGDGSGGNQSFSAAFLDESGRGVVFSSIYSRGQASVYAKPVENSASSFELTDEEKQAIDKAKASLLTAPPASPKKQ